MENICLSDAEYQFIATLPKFDLEMLLSEINDHGWVVAKKTLVLMSQAAAARPSDFYRPHKQAGVAQ